MSDRTAYVNGLTIDGKTGAIRIGRGASGWFSVSLGVESGAIDTTKDIVLFVIARKESSRMIISTVNGVQVSGSMDSDCVLKKSFSISVDDDGAYECVIALSNADTRAIDAGEYLWNGILITDPSYDTSGGIVIEDSDCVVPFYIDGDRPTLSVEEVGCIV